MAEKVGDFARDGVDGATADHEGHPYPRDETQLLELGADGDEEGRDDGGIEGDDDGVEDETGHDEAEAQGGYGRGFG